MYISEKDCVLFNTNIVCSKLNMSYGNSNYFFFYYLLYFSLLKETFDTANIFLERYDVNSDQSRMRLYITNSILTQKYYRVLFAFSSSFLKSQTFDFFLFSH